MGESVKVPTWHFEKLVRGPLTPAAGRVYMAALQMAERDHGWPKELEVAGRELAEATSLRTADAVKALGELEALGIVKLERRALSVLVRFNVTRSDAT